MFNIIFRFRFSCFRFFGGSFFRFCLNRRICNRCEGICRRRCENVWLISLRKFIFHQFHRCFHSVKDCFQLEIKMQRSVQRLTQLTQRSKYMKRSSITLLRILELTSGSTVPRGTLSIISLTVISFWYASSNCL